MHLTTNHLVRFAVCLPLISVASGVQAQADPLKLRESCGPVLERKSSMLPQHQRGWVNVTYGKIDGNKATFVRETPGTPGFTEWTLSSAGNGSLSLSGYWEHQTEGRRNAYIPVNLFADKFPITAKTRYMMGDGFRECELSISLESGKSAAVAAVFVPVATAQAQVRQAPLPEVKDSPTREEYVATKGQVAVNTAGVAQNKQDIAITRVQVAENSAGIAQNRQDISGNRKEIATAKVQIADNAAGVAQNRQAVAQNQQEMKSRTTTVSEKYGKPTTGTAETWATYMSGVPFQQNQFCRIIQNWREDLAMAQQQRNQIKENIAYRTREQRLTALMPDGNFQNWIVRAISVKQASDGSASVLFELPCDVVIGSHACGMTPKNFLGTIAENSRLYSELVTISVGDFLGVSGSFSFIDERASFKKDRSVASFTTMKAGTHCDAKEVAKPESEFFASQVATLSTLK